MIGTQYFYHFFSMPTSNIGILDHGFMCFAWSMAKNSYSLLVILSLLMLIIEPNLPKVK